MAAAAVANTTGPTGVKTATPNTPMAPKEATVLTVSTELRTLALTPSDGVGTTDSLTANDSPWTDLKKKLNKGLHLTAARLISVEAVYNRACLPSKQISIH